VAELPGPDVLHASGEVVAYAGLNPRQHQSGTSVDRAHVSPSLATPFFALHYTFRPIRHAVQSRNRGASNSVEVPRSPQTQADCRGRDAKLLVLHGTYRDPAGGPAAALRAARPSRADPAPEPAEFWPTEKYHRAPAINPALLVLGLKTIDIKALIAQHDKSWRLTRSPHLS
jgi:hypothetical protein